MTQTFRIVSQGHRQLLVEMKRSLLVSLPLIGAQLLHVGNSMIDALIAGRIGKIELAAGGIGASIFTIILLGSIGLMASLSPTMAQAIGQSQRREVGRLFRQGLWLALLLGALGLGLLGLIIERLPHWSLAPELVPKTQSYLAAIRWGIPPALLFLAARNVCEATGRGRAVLIVQLIGLVINLLGNLAFGLGWFGFPALGLAGIGWSTSLVMLCTCLSLFCLLAGKRFRSFGLYDRFEWPDSTKLLMLLSLSAPIALAILFEAGLFTATAIQMGMLGTVPASAHNIAIGVAALLYMLPLGLGMSLTARVGVAFGRKSIASARLRVGSGVIITLIMALCSAATLIALHQFIPKLYTSDPDVQHLAAQLLLLAAVFQISDSFQVTLLSMLRGFQDTRFPMIINAFSYWVVAFGFSYYMTQILQFGAHALWVALIIGLSLSAGLLSWRLRWVLNQRSATPSLAVAT